MKYIKIVLKNCLINALLPLFVTRVLYSVTYGRHRSTQDSYKYSRNLNERAFLR